ncbi:MAG: hypothetical protein ACYDAQ_09700, partial [Mycobacteriales bacterium]
ERILAVVDSWLNTLTDLTHLYESRLGVELDRMLAAVRAGMDPALAAGETRRIQAEAANARSIIDRWERSHERAEPLDEHDVRATLTTAGGLVYLLARAERTDRAQLCQALGVSLRYERDASTGLERVHARSQLRSSGGSV